MICAFAWWMVGFIGSVILAVPLTIVHQTNTMLHDAIEC